MHIDNFKKIDCWLEVFVLDWSNCKRKTLVKERISVTPEELKTEFDRQYERFKNQPYLLLIDIFPATYWNK